MEVRTDARTKAVRPLRNHYRQYAPAFVEADPSHVVGDGSGAFQIESPLNPQTGIVVLVMSK